MEVVSMPVAKKGWKSAATVGSGLALLALCAVVQLFGKVWTTASASSNVWYRTLDSFMLAMASGDAQGAYDLYSAAAHGEFTLSELQNVASGPDRILFEGYLGLEITGWELNYSTGGTYVELSGAVDYEGGHTGAFEAVLAQAGDRWLLQFFDVVVPPEKFTAMR